ncbi:uncharacterized protein LOC113773053 [Coffea eugenioides]|uniref:uncharacterized protein LOC113773053 n=1 Tax=Coffea eugenioides TaxID=49369 RepID=UPI000F604DCD|nr:uncharacterized protein LOC113773053 [Coffea eugenioides]
MLKDVCHCFQLVDQIKETKLASSSVCISKSPSAPAFSVAAAAAPSPCPSTSAVTPTRLSSLFSSLCRNIEIWILTWIKKETSKRQKRKKWECKGDLLENEMGDLPLSSCQKVDQWASPYFIS